MRDWSFMRRDWFERRGVAPETYIMAKVIEGLDKYHERTRGEFRAANLLDAHILKDFCRRTYTINEWIPVSPRCIQNYNSWLYKLKDGGCGVLIATSHKKSGARILPNMAEWAQGPSTRVMAFLTLLAHEIGHVAMEHLLAEITDLQPTEKYPSMKAEHEWEAWLFAEFMRAFIIADYSVETKQNEQRDCAPDLFL